MHTMKQAIKILLILSTLTGLSLSSWSQQEKSWQWVTRLGGISWDMTGGIDCDSKNNIYVAGSFSDTLFAGSEKTGSAGSRDMFIAKLDEKGDVKGLWSGGGWGNDQATCLAVSEDNNVIIGGLITGDATFGDINVKGEETKLFILNMDDRGKCGWLTTLLPTEAASLFLVTTDSDNNIYAAGIFSGSLTAGSMTIKSHGRKDIFTARLNPSGTIERLIAFGGSEDDVPTALSVSDSGMVVIAGICGEAFAVGDVMAGQKASDSGANAFIIALGKDLEALWSSQITGEEYACVSSLQMDSSNNIYVAGSFNLSLRVNDTALFSNGYTDGFLIKYLPNGQLIWGRNFGTWYYDYAINLMTDNVGGVLITGSVGDTLTIDSLMVEPASQNSSALAIQFSTQGDATWADCISGNGRNFASCAVLDHKGNLYLAGTFDGKLEKALNEISSLGDQDVFVAKYTNCPSPENEITGIPFICEGETTLLSVKREYSNIVWNDTIAGVYYIIADTPGQYQVRMTDKLGCIRSDTMEITMAASKGFSLGNDATIPVDSALLLHAPETFTNYRWQDDSENPTFVARAENRLPGTYLYWLTATDPMGCTSRDTISVEFFKTPLWLDPDKVELVVYPNPVDNWLNWILSTGEPCRLILELTDEYGKTVLEQYVEQYLPGTTMGMDFNDIPYGSYYLRLKNSSGESTRGISIVRK